MPRLTRTSPPANPYTLRVLSPSTDCEGVTGDYHSVVGISLPLLRSMATELGVFWPDLWDAPRP